MIAKPLIFLLVLTIGACGSDSYTPATGGLLGGSAGSPPAADVPMAGAPNPVQQPTPSQPQEPVAAPQPVSSGREYLVRVDHLIPEHPYLVKLDLDAQTLVSATRLQLGEQVNRYKRLFDYRPVRDNRNLEFAHVVPCRPAKECWVFFNPDGTRNSAVTIDFQSEGIVPSPDGSFVAVMNGDPTGLNIYTASGDFVVSKDLPGSSVHPLTSNLDWLSNDRLIYMYNRAAGRRSFAIIDKTEAGPIQYWNLPDSDSFRGQITSLVVAPNGRDVVFTLQEIRLNGNYGSQVVILNSETGALKRVAVSSEEGILELARLSKAFWSSDGQTLLIMHRPSEIEPIAYWIKVPIGLPEPVIVASPDATPPGTQWLVWPAYYFSVNDEIRVDGSDMKSTPGADLFLVDF